MTDTGRRIIRNIRSERRQVGKQEPNWLELPYDIFECIIGHLHWTDRIRIGAVCKALSVPTLHIPTIDRVPWAVTAFSERRTNTGQIFRQFQLFDPFSREYVVEQSVRGNEFQDFRFATPCASIYGWILLQKFEQAQQSLWLFSLFSGEVIKLPELEEFPNCKVVTFSLNATSPKCFIFFLHMQRHRIFVKICSPGDCSWKTFEFNGFDGTIQAVDAIYADGVFYCVFSGGQLGAFNVEREEWTILVDRPMLEFNLKHANLIASDTDLLLYHCSDSVTLYKFDFSKKRWVAENSLNNRVLFIGCTSFSAPAVGETSKLANIIFSCGLQYPVRFYGIQSCSFDRSFIYRKYLEAAILAEAWVQPPLGGIWRANDLINAA